MPLTVSIADVASNVVDLYETKRNGRPMPILLLGRPGQAKSVFVETEFKRRLAAHYDCEVDVIVDMPAQRDSVDYRGIVIPFKGPNGTPESAYTKPDLVARIEKSPAYKDGIVVLFMDEMLLSDHLTQKALTDPVLNSRLGEWQLPDNVWIVAASNYQQDGAGVNKAITILTNRIAVFDVVLPMENWQMYAMKRGVPPLGLAFADFRKDLFMQATPRDGLPFITYRSFTDAMEFIRVKKARMGDTDPMKIPSDHFTRARVAGSIGEAAMVELYAFADTYAELPRLSDIIADPMSAKVPPIHRMDCQYACAHMLMASVTASNINSLWKYAERLVRELQATIIERLTSSDSGGVLLNSPDVAAWIARPENRALLVATHTK